MPIVSEFVVLKMFPLIRSVGNVYMAQYIMNILKLPAKQILISKGLIYN